jgi:hypothetical protein
MAKSNATMMSHNKILNYHLTNLICSATFGADLPIQTLTKIHSKVLQTQKPYKIHSLCAFYAQNYKGCPESNAPCFFCSKYLLKIRLLQQMKPGPSF